MINYLRVLFFLAWALWALVHVLGFTVGEEVSEEQLLHLLQPTSRSSEYGWMNLHQQYVQEVEAAKGQVGRLPHVSQPRLALGWQACLHKRRKLFASRSSTYSCTATPSLKPSGGPASGRGACRQHLQKWALPGTPSSRNSTRLLCFPYLVSAGWLRHTGPPDAQAAG